MLHKNTEYQWVCPSRDRKTSHWATGQSLLIFFHHTAVSCLALRKHMLIKCFFSCLCFDDPPCKLCCNSSKHFGPHLTYLIPDSTNQLLRSFISRCVLCPAFQRSLLREFLLTKLINAEISCYKAQQFSRLEVEEKTFYFCSLLVDTQLHVLSCPVPPLLWSSGLVHRSWKVCRLNSPPVPSAWWGIDRCLLSPRLRA